MSMMRRQRTIPFYFSFKSKARTADAMTDLCALNLSQRDKVI